MKFDRKATPLSIGNKNKWRTLRQILILRCSGFQVEKIPLHITSFSISYSLRKEYWFTWLESEFGRIDLAWMAVPRLGLQDLPMRREGILWSDYLHAERRLSLWKETAIWGISLPWYSVSKPICPHTEFSIVFLNNKTDILIFIWFMCISLSRL